MITDTIISQLGAGRFVAMTGAKFTDSGDTLIIRLTIGKASRVTIKLEGDDTYTVRAYKGRGKTIPVEFDNATDVYADRLRAVFEELTGLATSL